MPTPEVKDYPLDTIRQSMQDWLDKGAVTFFKWTCAGCGDRVTANEPNTVLTQALHEDCGHTTDCEKQGGNFLFIAAVQK